MKTKTKTANALAALKGMTPKQLRERYAELYGEPSRSGNKQWLIRRCAWRIQALAEVARQKYRAGWVEYC